MIARGILGAALCAASAALAQVPEKPACRDRIRDFDERRAAVRQAQDEAASASEVLARRTQALDAERAATDNSNKRELGLYNVRAREHRERVEAHNKRLDGINADIEAFNKELALLRVECAPQKPPS